MNMIDIKTNEAAIFSLYLNTRLMYGDKRYIEIIFLTVYFWNNGNKLSRKNMNQSRGDDSDYENV